MATVIRAADEAYGHAGPFAKISVLSGIMKKASDSATIEWAVFSINDLFRNDMMGIGELSWDALTGYRTPGHKGTIDLLTYKRDMLFHLMDTFATKHPFDPSFVAKIRETFHDHEGYRAKVEPMLEAKAAPNFVHPDISYRTTWKKSGRLLAT